MKKNLFLLVLLVTIATSCNQNAAQKQAENKTVAGQAEISSNDVPSYTMDNLLTNAESLIDKKVKVKGYVTHTCKHSGRRCFLANESQQYTIRVEAKGNIGGFNRELIGSEIEVTGTLKERRVSVSEIDEMGKAIEEKRLKDDGSSESCDAEMTNIAQMREWMKKHGKNYYAIYYINGEVYNEL